MESFSTETFIVWMAILSGVIAVSALLSGLVERTGFPHIAVFLGFGALLGPHGLGLLDVGLESPFLRVVATLGLTLVLFTDAVALNIREVRRDGRLALRLLGPGTLISAALMTLVGGLLLDLSWPMALVLGAALASTDPVLLRGLLRREEVPAGARQALRLESGLNDVVLLPIVVVALTLATAKTEPGLADWGHVALNLFVLGPGAGVLIGLLGIAALEGFRRWFGVRRDYESLYSLGLAFAAFATAEAFHGSGFLAAFAAGLTIAALDVALCDCFLEYGEVTAEMLLLLTFVLFGASLIWTGLADLTVWGLGFALFAILVRLPVYKLSLAGTGLDRRSTWLICWFGGRGLSSLLLVLLAVFAQAPGSGRIFQLCCLVVLVSIVLHGGSSMALNWSMRDTSNPKPESKGHEAGMVGEPGTADPHRMTFDEWFALSKRGQPMAAADVRPRAGYESSPTRIQGAIRLDPRSPVQQATKLGLPRDTWIAAYCA